MIGRLVGTVAGDGADGRLVIDVGGVGYEVTVPLGTAGRLTATGGDGRVVVHVHTVLRQDALELYAFATELEKRVFKLLVGVPSVGPKLTLAVLGELTPPDLVRAVQSGDVARLTRIKGIGKRTAERLVLELKEKLPLLVGTAPAPPGAAPNAGPRAAERLAGALTNMGYRPAEAQRAVKALGDRVETAPIADLLREALAVLAGPARP